MLTRGRWQSNGEGAREVSCAAAPSARGTSLKRPEEVIMSVRNARSRGSSCAFIEQLEGRQLLSTTYYVSPSGNNNFAGTITKPWQTLYKVNTTKFNPGDQILLQGGATFNGSIYLEQTDVGTSAAPIKISSYGTGRATISPGTTSAIYAYNTAGYSISNLNLVGSGAGTSTGVGIFFYTDLPNNVKLNYVKVDQVESSGFSYGMEVGAWNLSTGYDTVSITNSSFHDNARAGLSSFAQNMNVHTNVYVGHVKAYNNAGVAAALLPSGTVTGHGIVLASVNGAKVERSLAYNNGTVGDGGAGIWTYDSTKVVFQYNESHHNHT